MYFLIDFQYFFIILTKNEAVAIDRGRCNRKLKLAKNKKKAILTFFMSFIRHIANNFC